MYRLPKAEHDELVNDAVTAPYKKAPGNIKGKIDKEGIKYAKEAKISDKMLVHGTSNGFVTQGSQGELRK